jgi:hypothetical protein
MDKSKIITVIVDTLNLEKTRLHLFNDQHGIFKDSGIWQGRSSIELGEMKSAIEAIISKLNQFKNNFQQEKEQLSQQA